MIPAAKSSGAYLVFLAVMALPFGVGVFGAWLVALLLPPFFIVMAALLVLHILACALSRARFLFVGFGFIPALGLFVLGASSEMPKGDAAMTSLSVFLPFAAIQFLFALMRHPDPIPK